MKKLLSLTLGILCLSACSGEESEDHENEAAAIASETGSTPPLPPDVLYAAKPLISGKLYSQPNFKASSTAYFDTSQQINVLDTAHTMFVKARIRQDTAVLTGYVPKTILPERKK